MVTSANDATLRSMQRRTLLALGFGSAALLVIAGGSLALIAPGLDGVKLGSNGQVLFRAVAWAVLDGMLPLETTSREAALDAHLQRIDATIAGLPAPTRTELSQLIALLGSAPGRRLLTGLPVDWPDASGAELQAALQSMRESPFELPQQAYHALRDLTNAAYFADPRTWPLVGYPGPQVI